MSASSLLVYWVPDELILRDALLLSTDLETLVWL